MDKPTPPLTTEQVALGRVLDELGQVKALLATLVTKKDLESVIKAEYAKYTKSRQA